MGFTQEDKFRICTRCGREFPNTVEFFGWAKKGVRLKAVCKECQSIIAKEKNERAKANKPEINRPVYDGTKECICCHRQLPNDWMHFPTDKTSKTGLRNKCRECTPNYGHFLNEDANYYVKWTDEENQLMIENYSKYTGEELKDKYFPNRTVRAIESQASNLGIVGKNEEVYWNSRKVAAQKVGEKLKGRTLSEAQKLKMSQTKKEYFKTHDGWWKGKKRSDEQRKMISERMKGKWAGENNPRAKNPLIGEKNGRWAGGITNSYFELRSDTKQWQQDSMEFCNYKCVITGSYFKEIHHTIPFKNIVDDAHTLLMIKPLEKVQDYNSVDFERLRNKILDLHNLYGYGACLNRDVHRLFHNEYGYTDFDITDFIDFINKVKCGEYNDWFIKNQLDINVNEDYLEYIININNNIKALKD